MALFAKLDANNVVMEVNVIDDKDINFLTFPASEAAGIAFLTQWSGGYTNWKQTCDKKSFRVHYAAPGYTYDSERDAFIPWKPFPSWIFVEETLNWKPPVDYPRDGKYYLWDEPTLSWIEAA